MQNYTALIIDIENSKTYDTTKRINLQYFITYYTTQLNQLFCNHISCPLMFSAGDEMQGLFHETTPAVLYFRLLELLLYPVHIRAGIGIGEWTVRIPEGMSTEQDGPAYHNARRAITAVHKKQLQNILICSPQEHEDILSTHLLNAAKTLKQQHSYMQNLVLVISELLYPFVTRNINETKYVYIKNLLNSKFQFSTENFNFQERSVTFEPNIEKELHIHPILIDGSITNVENALSEKNIALNISEILGCSRQNADTLLKRGNANKIRELDYMALQYICLHYGG